jgi:CBS domain-containing protein
LSEVASFLSRFAPFKGLSTEVLEDVASALAEVPVRAGQRVLVEDGPPGQQLFVVREGAMELTRGGKVVDVVGPGEAFGHPTLLTGEPPAFTVQAREDSVLLVVPRLYAESILGSPNGVAFVAGTLRERLMHTAAALRAMPESRAVHVASLIRNAPVYCDPETPIREAALRMREGGAREVLILSREGLGIVTDGDFGDKVVAEGLSLDAPVATIMTTPVATIRGDQLAPEASIEMMRAGVNHLPVVDGRGKVIGVVTSYSLMTLDSLSPFTLRAAIANSRDERGLIEAVSRLPEVFVALLDARVDAPGVSRVLSLQRDAVTVRLLKFAVERYGEPPADYAWLALGSEARDEVTLASDQDNALAFGDSDDPAATDEYFARVAADVNAGFTRCGFPEDISDVLARNREWRRSQNEWAAVFAECLAAPHRSNLVRAAIMFDFRKVTGDLAIERPLSDILREAHRYPGFLGRLARTATDIKSPLGFRQRLIGPIDIKKSALQPIENLARLYAFSSGVTASSTLDRLAAVEGLGQIDDETVQGLREALLVAWRVRLQHHAAKIQAGRAPDNYIDTADLPPLARLDLQAALRVIAAAQRKLSRFVPMGM